MATSHLKTEVEPPLETWRNAKYTSDNVQHCHTHSEFIF
jgi:hypothetical protein